MEVVVRYWQVQKNVRANKQTNKKVMACYPPHIVSMPNTFAASHQPKKMIVVMEEER